MEIARRNVDWLQVIGTENKFEKLIDSKWPATEVDAWEMTSVACFLLQAEGVYRSPSESLQTFMILDNIRWADQSKK